jgi:hypothetical protein
MKTGSQVDVDLSTGRVIRIPNGNISAETLAHYNKGFQYFRLSLLWRFPSGNSNQGRETDANEKTYEKNDVHEDNQR